MKDNIKQRYTEQLLAGIKERTGEVATGWLLIQVESTALNMAILRAISDELMEADKLLIEMDGSKGQSKKEAHPLLPYFDKLQRTVTLQLQALGLNYNTTPSKVTENTNKAIDEKDNLMHIMMDLKRGAGNPKRTVSP